MCVLNGSQMHWTKEMEELFISEGKIVAYNFYCDMPRHVFILAPHLGSKGPVTFYQRQLMQLADMTVLVRGNLSKGARTTGYGKHYTRCSTCLCNGASIVSVGALTVIDVHARDVIKKLVDDQVKHNPQLIFPQHCP